MTRQIRLIDYDEQNDILYISDGEKVKASIDIGDFILDVSHTNYISGIEIIDASEHLDISKESLSSISHTKMSVTYRNNNVYVLLTMAFEKEGKQIHIPIPLTLNLGHKEKKELFIC